ncbi:hypothetical protein FOZ60_000520 [Perkinsus olseni]|uniref:Uncharacterized protein n=1 Tax=Perkinsus olseni TaxID=32597 RepID=A0A7J6N100_PEROL|nr:hypothetical protein FOZ60_000520 [Perkinsus olseni]
MVERVWKESTVVGPLPELMCDLMAYIPKPALTLDRPMEYIIIGVSKFPKHIFADGGGVSAIFEDSLSLVLKRVYPPDESIILASPDEPGIVKAFQVDTSVSRVYALFKMSGGAMQLVEYCLADGRVCTADSAGCTNCHRSVGK